MSFFYSQLFVNPPYPLHSFAGQTAIVTGANVGLGLEAARHIAACRASKVIIAVRNLKAGEAAKLSIEKSTKCSPTVVEVWQLDLGSYDSVKAFGARVDRELSRLDVCLMNAGKATKTFDILEGHESTITVNVISTFLLALLVLPKMKETRKKNPDMARPTLTIVSSEVQFYTTMPARNSDSGIFKALDKDLTTPKDMAERYPVSKFLDVIGTRALADRISKDKDGKPLVIVNTVNPGLCHSELAREAGWGLYVLKIFLARTSEVGSRTLVHAAAAGNIDHWKKPDRVDGGLNVHGKYLSDCLIREPSHIITGKGKIEGIYGKKLQDKIWAELCDLMEGVVPGVTKNA